MFPIAPTETVLENLRKRHFSELLLAHEIPNVVFTCQVNQTFATRDRVNEVTYDNPTGTYGDVRPGMTAYVGSTAGARDLGLVRIRKAPTSSKVYIGEESEIRFANNVWLTVVDQFAPWAKHIRVDNRVPYMDWDIGYTNQHKLFDPVPVLGGPRVAWIKDPSTQTLNDNHASITYTGTWNYGDSGYWSDYGGNLHGTNTAGSYAEFTFRGKAVRWMSRTAITGGYADVYVDGDLIERVSLYSATTVNQVWVWEHDCGTNGQHTVRIVCVGAGEGDVDYRRDVWVDAIGYDGFVATVHFDASDSWAYDSSISSYSWTSPNSKSISASTAAQTDVLFDAPGQYMVYLDETAANGKAFTAARRVFVFDLNHLPLSGFTLDSCKADKSDGGWSFSITSGSLASTELVERNLCILFTRDYFDNEEIGYGPLSGQEPVMVCGWIGKNSIEYDANTGTVNFDCFGPHYWLKQMTAFPTGLELSPRTPTAWTGMMHLTVDKGVWHLLHWRTTLTQIMDYIPMLENVLYVKELSVTSGTLWQQLNQFTWSTIFSRLLFNRFGQAFLQVDPQLVLEADRAWDEWTLLKKDINSGITLGASQNGDVSLVDLWSVCIHISTSASAFHSLSPGHVFTHYGRLEPVDKILSLDQAHSNSLAGLYMGYKNNDLPSIRLEMMRDNRFVDIAPRMFINLTIEETDTPRGIAFDGRTLINSVTMRQQENVIFTGLELEAETFEQLSVNGDIPDSPKEEDITFPPPPPPPELPPLPIMGLPVGLILCDANHGMFYSLDVDSEYPTWIECNFGLEDIDPQYIDRLEVFPFSGRVYAASLSLEKVWTVEIPGMAWQLVTDGPTIIDSTFPGFEEFTGYSFQFKAFGINKNAGDQIALIAGLTSGPYPCDTYFFLGDSSGVSAVGNKWSMKDSGGDLTYGNGKWVFTGRTNNYWWETQVYRFPNNGGEPEHTELLPSGEATSPYHVRAGTGDVMFETSGDFSTMITGNGDAIEDLELTGLLAYEQCADIDPSGQIIMACKDTYPQISIDGGHTWNIMPELEENIQYRFANCNSDVTWVCAKNAVRVTLDGGLTWLDRTGNLTDLFAPDQLNITLIRVLKYAEQA